MQKVGSHQESVGRRQNWDWRRFLSLETTDRRARERERGSKLNVATKAEEDRQAGNPGRSSGTSERAREGVDEGVDRFPIVDAYCPRPPRSPATKEKKRATATAEENPIILAIPPSLPRSVPLLLLFPGEIGLLTLSDRRGEKVVCLPSSSLRPGMLALSRSSANTAAENNPMRCVEEFLEMSWAMGI